MAKENYEQLIEGALTKLAEAKRSLTAQISGYPTPISGCDAQFNRLLSDRSRISGALQSLQSKPFVPTPRMLEPAIALESR